LAEKRLQEANVSDEAKELAEINHLIVETDKKYGEKTRERSFKRNADVQRLSTKIRELEEKEATQQEIKFGFFQIRAKRKAAEQLTQTQQELKSTKNELQVTLENFTAEQEEMHDNCEKRKQELIEI